MSENAMLRHGAFSWCELMTTDVEAAKRFYTELLGWTTEEVPGMSYTIVKTGGNGVGGIMAVPPHAAGCPPQWGTYVTVDDVDATARKAQELGAKTIMPLTDIPNVGRFIPSRIRRGRSSPSLPIVCREPPCKGQAGYGLSVPPRWPACRHSLCSRGVVLLSQW
jgi:uncharacterized protein